MRKFRRKNPKLVTRETVRKIVCGISHLEFLTERGGLYCSFFRNSLVFCHFVRKTRIFCRFRPSRSSRIRLSSALQSLLWTSKVPKKSNISNKPGFPSWAYQNSARFQSALRESYHLNSQSQASASCPELSTSDRSTLADFPVLIARLPVWITSVSAVSDQARPNLEVRRAKHPYRKILHKRCLSHLWKKCRTVSEDMFCLVDGVCGYNPHLTSLAIGRRQFRSGRGIFL